MKNFNLDHKALKVKRMTIFVTSSLINVTYFEDAHHVARSPKFDISFQVSASKPV